MKTFDDRQKGFERKFAHDEEMQFKAQARRNRLLGLWAAGRMGVTGADGAREYAESVVRADFVEKGEDDVFAKVWGDLQAKNVAVSEQELREQMAGLLAEAKTQIMQDVEPEE
ncbi:MAG TPA: DUF1476 domain-containing protein [Paracoccaceae bacterium]|nr:DUF1476 domain-containing protein [Paracoccaceae bacterium]